MRYSVIFITALIAIGCQQKVDVHAGLSLATVEPKMEKVDYVKHKKEYKNPNMLKASDLKKWFDQPDNGYLKDREMGGVQYTLQYLPTDYMVINDLKTDDIGLAEYEQTKKQYSTMYYYSLKIEIPGYSNEIAQYDVSDYGEYTERIKYLSFTMQNDIYLSTDNGVDVPCTVFHFERTYNLTPYSTFLIGFEKTLIKESEMTVVLEDNLFNNGIIKFHWTNKEKSIPNLQLI